MVELCGRSYRLPRGKVAVFCVDGCAPEYLDCALADGLMPRLADALSSGGVFARGLGQMPSFTNPNNLSIVTGQPPVVHGLSGNTYLEADKEVPMTSPSFLRAPTLLERMEAAGVKTLCVTAKDKLRALLGANREGGRAPLSLSAEKAHEQSLPEEGVSSIVAAVGRKNPSIYDWDASHYAMEMGLALADRVGARLLYVSLTDYVQHKEAPGGEMSNRFYARFDTLLGAYLDAGFTCAFTADHGMNDKTKADGSPNVRYLDDILADGGVHGARVVLPITDPYVVHHGALGSFATVYLPPDELDRAAAALSRVDGVEGVLQRADAAARFRLPPDRIGDLVVLGDRHTVLGKSERQHDLSAVRTGLRSHGGLAEVAVPLVVCHPLSPDHRRRAGSGTASNADIFDFVLNGVA